MSEINAIIDSDSKDDNETKDIDEVVETMLKVFGSITHERAYYLSSILNIPVKVLKRLKDKNDFKGFANLVCDEIFDRVAKRIKLYKKMTHRTISESLDSPHKDFLELCMTKTYEEVFAFNLKLKENNIETPELDEILKKLYENECFCERRYVMLDKDNKGYISECDYVNLIEFILKEGLEAKKEVFEAKYEIREEIEEKLSEIRDEIKAIKSRMGIE